MPQWASAFTRATFEVTERKKQRRGAVLSVSSGLQTGEANSVAPARDDRGCRMLYGACGRSTAGPYQERALSHAGLLGAWPVSPGFCLCLPPWALPHLWACWVIPSSCAVRVLQRNRTINMCIYTCMGRGVQVKELAPTIV